MSIAIEQIRLLSKLTIIHSEIFAHIDPYAISNIVAHIDTYAFADCINLISVGWDADPEISEIGDGAFSNTSLTVFTFPSVVQVVDQYVFQNCVRLYQIDCRAFMTEIEESAFLDAPYFVSSQ